MARLRTYGRVNYPGERVFQSDTRKRTRKARAPITPALKENLAKERAVRQKEYQLALKEARDTVQQHALQLHSGFGAHSVDYYVREILQRGRLEGGRRKTSRWNAFVHHEMKLRNAGTSFVVPVPTPSDCVVSNTSRATKTQAE